MLSATAPPTSSLYHSLPSSQPAHTSHAIYIIGTLHYYISELFPLIHTSCKLSWYALSFTLLFSSLPFNTFLTPSILPALLYPPTTFSQASTKKWSDIPPSPLHTFTSNSLPSIRKMKNLLPFHGI